MNASFPFDVEFAALDAACPIELMKFTLIYDGELRSSGNSPKPEEKWRIRRALHPQLAELWQTHAVLSPLVTRGIWVQPTEPYLRLEQHHYAPEAPYVHAQNPGTVNLLAPIDVGQRKFVPLIRDSLSLICGLDILFLRKEEPGQLIKKGGDIDNRIKTLFDGLRIPQDNEMKFSGCEPVPEPFYCLLQDDSLIAEESVRTGRLLTRPNGSVFDVRLIIEVTVKVIHVRAYNFPLLGE